jgi:hypothetical protein
LHRGLAISEIQQYEVYENIDKEVISKFLDSNEDNYATFSIREVTDQGLESFHKVAGDWYGTNSISQVLRELNTKYKPYEDFEIKVFNDGIFFKEDVINLGSEIIKDTYKNKSGSIPTQTEDYFEQTRHGNQSGGSKEFKGSPNIKILNSNKFKIPKEESKSNPSSGSSNSSASTNEFMHNNEMRRWNK